MAQHFYYNIMRKIIVQTLDIFKDIKIAKYNDAGGIDKYIKVPLQFAPKTKQWYFQQSKRNSDGLTINDNVYPVMAMQLTGLEFARDRAVNNLQKIITESNDGNIITHLTPIPYDYMFNLEIVGEHFIDILQIIEQLLPWFNPHVIIRITIPELNIQVQPDKDNPNSHGSEPLEIRITYGGISPEQPAEIDMAEVRLLRYTIDFIAKGFLFQPIQDEKSIQKIVHEVYANKKNFVNSLSMGTSGTSGNQLYRDIISNSDIFKYDEDIKILFDMEREDNV